MSNMFKTTVIAGLLSAGAVLATGTGAWASYTTTRCDGDTCRVQRCDDDGGFCRTVSLYDRFNGRHYYTSSDYFYHPDYSRHRHWVCDAGGDNCTWSYTY